MIKDCSSCMHKRVCKYTDKYEEYGKEMRGLIEKWGKDNPFGFTEDCPEWHEVVNIIKINKDDLPKAKKSDYDIWCEQEKCLSSIKSKRKEEAEPYDFVKELEKVLAFRQE